MIKQLTIAAALLYLGLPADAQNNWAPAGTKIKTEWASAVNPASPLPEYPRPQMVRKAWTNLNGLWQYAVTPKSQEAAPAAYAGRILVPFAVESALSGVGKTVGKDSVLWYQRSINLPASARKGRTLLHFGAVDWQCTVWVNGKEVGSHQGGYDPFSFDISNALNKGAAQNIAIRVWDPSDDGPQPRGKQVKKPESIWYTPVTGIWQTVWLEAVPDTYIAATKQTPDVDAGQLALAADVAGAQPGDELRVTAFAEGKQVASQTGAAGGNLSLAIDNPRLWSPETPFLYDLKIALLRKGKVVDEVDSYFAMRKIKMNPDAAGIQRMLLNDRFVFQYGPLDQGWWPDGLYTAPTDAALKFDIEKTKEMGFNMIRKHVKVEPARWYWYCDKMGMLVWQDMPSGDLGNRWEARPGVYGRASDKDRTAASESIYRKEWAEIMQDLHNFPSIVVWVPFNEAWGQFKTRDITEWTMKQDPSRLVNSASGGNFEPVGHIMDLHNYPDPAMPDPKLFGSKQILVLGEYGGLGLPQEGHTWQDKNNWGYQSYKNSEDLYKRYAEFIGRIPALIESGLSAAVYTQTTDVEIETNGLMTYDRKVIKMPVERLNQLHQVLYKSPVQLTLRK
ncbi:Glycosyl hydrolases family 2, TIM barrel domain [Cnuella takakiae]|uniref:Glycosyl hydrolases family 2, TIM barrel domain n=1 Tax=Cnuella takakiae TaxID=1302690 RepID=A0A1M5IB45_9BACT|nr:sugar-binding domain-containing protein [Cnuella takakiae]OLY90785.1 beta-galactosidase [Cnuella takakiae]SHG25608.1 Glycosyl hydrolases family 2, TIM barrel domain [Cnuella takakiae]